MSSIPARAGIQRAVIKTRNGTITSVQSGSSQSSQTSVTVPSGDLVLSVNANTNTQLTGVIKLNGKVIRQLNSTVELELSPYLSVGSQTLVIIGTYNPVNASVGIQLQGPNTQVSLSSGGTGKINQTLVLDVQQGEQ